MTESDDRLVSIVPTAPGAQSAQVGDRVAAILDAAEQAAEEIRAAARRQGAELIRQAEEAVAARIQELTREAERIKEDAEAEARDVRLAVEAYGKSRRREADEAVAKKVEDTERRAREILAEAEQRGQAYESQMQARSDQITREVHELEARRERVVRGLQDLAGHINELVRRPSPGSPAVEPTADRQEIEDALEVRRPRRELTRRRLSR